MIFRLPVDVIFPFAFLLKLMREAWPTCFQVLWAQAVNLRSVTWAVTGWFSLVDCSSLMQIWRKYWLNAVSTSCILEMLML